ncbi:sterol desaturase family protein [Gynuella sunshinyii]|uniref:Sterol desaturase n=1 Tax=Gynuella sunshinyii YC6258 TaxID=1445510 RepID=A0A0C5VR53_9GAMM|nr:sterol desaturase family protein [Gynuella sunshinyii]AJQ95883.1 sterol desaturase [Gynuella sunshinyii YC6258]
MYFGLIMLYGGLGEAAVRAIAVDLSPDTNSWPLWFNVLVAILAGSFVGYWQHRLEHRVDILWPVHGIHHVPDKVNITNNSVVHFIELICGTILTQLVLLTIGISDEGLLISGLFTIMQGYFIHTNSDIRIGRWNHVLASCELHRFHHSNYVPEAGNFGSEIVLWDKLFGSYIYRPDQKQLEVGVAKPHTFPSPFNIIKGWWHPFRYWFRRVGRQPPYFYTERSKIPVRDRLEHATPSDSQ